MIKQMEYESETGEYGDESKNFTIEDLESVRILLINLERVIENIPMIINGEEGTTFPGGYIFELLQQVNVCDQQKSNFLNK